MKLLILLISLQKIRETLDQLDKEINAAVQEIFRNVC